MQVAHHKDHITHAVIGGGQTIDFGISNSAEFFNILSSTLYKDQILAVVREVLCNAWDAHIEAGCTHIPVEITLTDDKFVIKDFGSGIHRDDMGLIYGTYGNSTKKNDGTQTGGFGLGCKAPFAYTDHFEVVSNHDSVKTIYNLSKSSAQAQGKPGIVPIASYPTKDTGLQVSIHIKNAQDQNRFKTLIMRIVKNGDMHMSLNGDVLPKLGFDLVKANYLITSEYHLLDAPTQIMVRYGNVIYPVDLSNEIKQQYMQVQNHLLKLSDRNTNYRIVLQAPPHSISVTPSRETLSMQEHTVGTLNKLMADFMDMIQTGFEPECQRFAVSVIEDAVKEAKVSELLSRKNELPLFNPTFNRLSMINDLGSMARLYMQKKYPDTLVFRKKDVRTRLQAMAVAGLLDRGLVQTYLRDLEKVQSTYHYQQPKWLQRQVIAPLLTKLTAAGIDHTRLFVYDQGDVGVKEAYNRNGRPPLMQAVNACPENLLAALPYLRNIVVISTSKYEIKERAIRRDQFNVLGGYDGYFFYHASMKKSERDAAISFFKSTGMVVVDLTVKLPSEIKEAERKISNTGPREPAKKGLPLLASTYQANNREINIRRSSSPGAARILTPEFVVPVSFSNNVSQNCLEKFDDKASRYIVELFGKVGAVTNNSLVHSNWIKKGAKDYLPYLREKVAEYMMTNPRIAQYWAVDVDRVLGNDSADSNDKLHLAFENQKFLKAFGLNDQLTEEDHKYLYLWKRLTGMYRYGHLPDDLMKAKAYLNKIPVDPISKKLVEKFEANPLLDMISQSSLYRLLKGSGFKPQHIDAAIDMLIFAINNK